MSKLFAFGVGDSLGGGGGGGSPTVAIVVGVSDGVVDTAGKGQRLVVQVDHSATASGIKAGGVAFTAFAIDDATHVSGIPGAHAAGVVDVVVTNATGDSTTGTGLIRYWGPSQITGATRYFDADKSVTDAGAGQVSSWIDQIAADDCTQGTGANRPILTAGGFGTMPSLRFTPQQYLVAATGEGASSPVTYMVVGKTTSVDASSAQPTYNPALCIFGASGGWGGFGVNGGAVSNKIFSSARDDWGSGVNDGNPHLFGMTANATPTRQGYIDGAAVGSPSSPGGTPLSYWNVIGAGFGPVDGWDGDVGAIITCSATVISAPDLALLTAWSKQRWGTP